MKRNELERALLLYAVTDRAWLNGRTLTEVCREALAAGVTMLQLREKNGTGEETVRQGKELAALCRACGVPFIVNDDAEAAVLCGADGVHVGQRDLEAERARAVIGPDKVLGVSAETVEQAVRAERAGADYLGVGAVFPTSTKRDASAVELETLKKIRESVSIPVVAIGGITAKNLPRLSASGVDGVAVVSAVFAEKDIPAAVNRLKRSAQKMVVRSYSNYLFDLDGTLIDSMPFWKNSPAEFLRESGYEPPEGIYEAMKTMDMPTSARYCKERFGFPGYTALEIQERMNACMAENYGEKIGLKPGVSEFLLWAFRAGKKLALVTATDRSLAEPCLKRLGILQLFSVFTTCSEEGLSKENGEIYRVAASRLGGTARDTLVFEDALHAVNAAVSAGFKTAGVYEASAPGEQEAVKRTAQIYLRDFTELGEEENQ